MVIDEKEFKQKIWYYYLMLEEDFLSTKNIVQIDKGNFSVFGLRYLNIIEACCSEIDALLKIFYETDTGKAPKRNANINFLWFYAQNKLFIGEDNCKLKDYKISIVINDIDLQSWKDYEVLKYKDKKGNERFKPVKDVPTWWADYNAIKHKRMTAGSNSNFKKANLENAVNALTGLYSLLLSFVSYFKLDLINNSIDFRSKLFNENMVATDEEIKEMLGIS